MNLFITGFLQVFFVAVNTFFISHEFYSGVFVCGFIISFIWSWNVKKVAFGSMDDRIYYSLGAATGAYFGLLVSANLLKFLA